MYSTMVQVGRIVIDSVGSVIQEPRQIVADRKRSSLLFQSAFGQNWNEKWEIFVFYFNYVVFVASGHEIVLFVID